MVLFKGLGPRHTRSFPFVFSTATSPLTQSIGFWTVSMISKSTSHFNSFSNFNFKMKSIFLTGITTGVTLSLISIWWVFFRVLISPKQSENSDKNCSLLTFTAEIRFIQLKRSLVANPRIGTGFESTIINKTSNWSLFSFIVIQHFPSTGILELLYVDNFMFVGQMSGSGSEIYKIVKEVMLYWAPALILYETWIPFEGSLFFITVSVVLI